MDKAQRILSSNIDRHLVDDQDEMFIPEVDALRAVRQALADQEAKQRELVIDWAISAWFYNTPMDKTTPMAMGNFRERMKKVIDVLRLNDSLISGHYHVVLQTAWYEKTDGDYHIYETPEPNSIPVAIIGIPPNE